MKSVSLVIMTALLVFVYAADEHQHGMLDVFDEILKKLNVTEDYLPKEKINVFVNTVFRNFRCKAVGGTCDQTMCFNTTDVINIVNGDVTVGIQESQFEDLAVVLLYYVQNSAVFCRQQVDITQFTLDIYKTNFTQSLVTSELANKTNEAQLEEFLEVLNVTYVPVDEDEHEHEENEVLVFEEECLAADVIISNLGNGAETIQEDHFQEVAALLIYHFFSSSQIKHKCRLLPTKEFFIDELFESFHSVNNTLSKEEFKELLTKLGISSSTTQEDAHIHTERKKRSTRSENVMKRSKRAADEHEEHDHATVKSCYSADQLLTVYDTATPISKTDFTQLCPALIYQQTSEACKATTDHDDSTTPTEAERYGYSSLAVFIITLCALFGAILFPFSKNRCYDGFMAVFMGLAVGTLTSDALLHLIPEAFGIHKHSEEDGHDHGSGEIVVESFVWYAFAAIGSIYVFYLLETIFGMAGHSHSAPGHSHEAHIVGKESTSNGVNGVNEVKNGLDVVDKGEQKVRNRLMVKL
ncbi:zinc transporter ZIP12 [Patella vulgata]|uniref:zinc transporter ZIP12 n=1 Tax=Patella vulgata TaxID=6465 RepID=UPI0024A985EE|nr:zinc transporter ZIP12 [Patella vulgata]